MASSKQWRTYCANEREGGRRTQWRFYCSYGFRIELVSVVPGLYKGRRPTAQSQSLWLVPPEFHRRMDQRGRTCGSRNMGRMGGQLPTLIGASALNP